MFLTLVKRRYAKSSQVIAIQSDQSNSRATWDAGAADPTRFDFNAVK